MSIGRFFLSLGGKQRILGAGVVFINMPQTNLLLVGREKAVWGRGAVLRWFFLRQQPPWSHALIRFGTVNFSWLGKGKILMFFVLHILEHDLI